MGSFVFGLSNNLTDRQTDRPTESQQTCTDERYTHATAANTGNTERNKFSDANVRFNFNTVIFFNKINNTFHANTLLTSRSPVCGWEQKADSEKEKNCELQHFADIRQYCSRHNVSDTYRPTDSVYNAVYCFVCARVLVHVHGNRRQTFCYNGYHVIANWSNAFMLRLITREVAAGIRLRLSPVSTTRVDGPS